jgi:uncharacterized membrane protein
MASPGSWPKPRLEALTDGIFAVALTLLVLDLRFPAALLDPATSALTAAVAVVTTLDDYVISFIVLAGYWLAHVALMRRLTRVDSRFAVLNLAFLLFITVVPPLTSLAGGHPGESAAAALYGGNLAAALACEALLWRHCLLRLDGAGTGDGRATWRRMRRGFVAALCVIAAGIAVALIESRSGPRNPVAPYVYLLLTALGSRRFLREPR